MKKLMTFLPAFLWLSFFFFSSDIFAKNWADLAAEGAKLAKRQDSQNATTKSQQGQQALIQDQINSLDSFEDSDKAEYLSYIKSIDELAIKGQISPADTETKKYEALKKLRESQQTRQYRKSQLILQAQQLNSQQQNNFAQERAADAQEDAAQAQQEQANQSKQYSCLQTGPFTNCQKV